MTDDEELLTYRKAIEATKRFHQDPGEYDVLKEANGEVIVWCHPDDRQAFLDAGVPESALVHPRPGDDD